MTIAMPDWAIIRISTPTLEVRVLHVFPIASCASLNSGVSEKPLVNVSIWDVLKAKDEPQVALLPTPCSLMRMLPCLEHPMEP